MFLIKLIPQKILSQQAKKPAGFIGRYLMTKIFNEGNADLNDFVLEMLELKKDDHVLEIGFGTGTLIYKIADSTIEGVVEGVDFSEAMLKEAGKINKDYIAVGKVKLYKNDCKRLPFDENSFDKVCSSNIIYFWDKPQEYLKEMLRVIKPGGKLVIGFRDDKQISNLNLGEDVFNFYSQEQILEIINNAGFSNAEINEKASAPFISYCATAYKV